MPNLHPSEQWNDHVELIDTALQQGKAVLVHCLEGKMRSATIVTAYLMRLSNLKLDDAKEFVRAKHRPAFDFGCYNHFEPALQEWQSSPSST